MNVNYPFLLLWIWQAIFNTGKVEKASYGFCSPQTDSPGDAYAEIIHFTITASSFIFLCNYKKYTFLIKLQFQQTEIGGAIPEGSRG